jgi:Fe-S cluster assembly scaffold protein SufB
MELDSIQIDLLQNITGLSSFDSGSAFNLRLNGAGVARSVTENINIIQKDDKPGIDIFIKAGTKGEQVHIPVLLSESGVKETVFNDFHIGENADVTIIAGCGIHNCGEEMSEHSGIHSFYLGKNSKVKYIEKHYGSGDGNGQRVMNPTTYIELEEGSYLEMDTVQIKGVDSTIRKTQAVVGNDAKVVIKEKIMTHGKQLAKTEFTVDLNGENSGAHVVSRSVARDDSKQIFLSNVNGNNKCTGHSECDGILSENGKVIAVPALYAANIDASLIHEAAIGKIAGEQIIKLCTLGLTEEEAERKIIDGFLK